MGEGPLVVFCHGFPESWYSWRHQLPAVAAAGFRAVAMDMRGYGETTAPASTDAYTLSHMVGDVVALVAALDEEQAVVVGHDWGAPIAWYSALMRPDVFRGVVGMSVPYTAPIAMPSGMTMTDLMRKAAGPGREYYRLFFQEPGVAEANLEADIDRTVRGFLYSISGNVVTDGVFERGWDGHFPMGQDFMQQLVVPEVLPPWLTEEDVKFYAAELARSGFHGGLSWYRNINAQPAILSPFVGTTITAPSMYVSGENDLIAANPAAMEKFPTSLPGLRGVHVLPDAGHWIQQERPLEVNDVLVAFLTSL
ncbi:alpha/beta fold hydrolase [Mycobacterium sp. AZCC_0083]|uniref:alpha/beta fold hydrolase n=1 Tax=Mycobacterium sp. AZCC_0083 TaxID=2735882 RepID=UPI001801061D|nr:alpha/beta hydrolase [Mycobacterium sp. AZCC_0083]MBB5160746.1 pimeloyl-ACP methyl ester carboxylesterase [Mycobacterium sp. AZCC_0083]